MKDLNLRQDINLLTVFKTVPFNHLGNHPHMVENIGFEPMTSCCSIKYITFYKVINFIHVPQRFMLLLFTDSLTKSLNASNLGEPSQYIYRIFSFLNIFKSKRATKLH